MRCLRHFRHWRCGRRDHRLFPVHGHVGTCGVQLARLGKLTPQPEQKTCAGRCAVPATIACGALTAAFAISSMVVPRAGAGRVSDDHLPSFFLMSCLSLKLLDSFILDMPNPRRAPALCAVLSYPGGTGTQNPPALRTAPASWFECGRREMLDAAIAPESSSGAAQRNTYNSDTPPLRSFQACS